MNYDSENGPALVELRELSRRFVRPPSLAEKIQQLLGSPASERSVRAVDRVNLHVHEGEVLGLVGESGCGKSTLARLVAGLLPASAGQVLFRGEDIAHMDNERHKQWRSGVQMVFQDPFASLNPRMRIGEAISQAPVFHGLALRRQAKDLAISMLEAVGLPAEAAERYPHQFSGGQRQRIGIARALAMQPEFLICDEPVAALDVSVQAQVLNLFMDLREKLHLTYLFISHDLGVVEHLCDRVAVMYLGRIVEIGEASEVFSGPRHPYTNALLDEVPRVGVAKPAGEPIRGELPSPMAPPPGCHFHPRCPHAIARCRSEVPELRRMSRTQFAACHLSEIVFGIEPGTHDVSSAMS